MTKGTSDVASANASDSAVIPAAPAPASADAIPFVTGTHRNFQDMVRLADTKATALMAASGVIVALLGGKVLEGLGAAAPGGAILWLRATTLVILLVAGLCAILVLVPRFPTADQVMPVLGAPGLMWALNKYYRHSADYLRPLLQITAREVVADLAYENLKITWILERKWKWLGRAALSLFGAFVIWVATLIQMVLGG